ncbi:MAG: hypothetical protein SO440_11525 [Prevotella sp.]|nr:hypothetical protein [Prevotella sp.]
MKRTFILLALVASMPLTMNAQDDMYFVPTKKNVEKSKKDYGMPKDTYYSGSNRSVDDYNRRHTECWENQLKDGSQVVAIDSLGNEIATVNVKKGKSKHDSILNDDYKYTRMMEMWDGYQCSNAYWRGYNDGRFNRWYGWSSYYDPWYYSSWYGPYSLWYDPWFYGYGGWYDPWFYGYAGWYGGWHPYYDWGWHGHYYPVYGGGGGRHWTSSVERFKDNRFSRTSSTRISGSGISRGIANRDRTNSLGTRSINRNTASRRFGNSQGDIRNVSSNRNTSYNNNSSSFNSSRSSSFSSGGGSSFSSGGSRSFGGGGGGIKSSGAGRRR